MIIILLSQILNNAYEKVDHIQQLASPTHLSDLVWVLGHKPSRHMVLPTRSNTDDIVHSTWKCQSFGDSTIQLTALFVQGLFTPVWGGFKPGCTSGGPSQARGHHNMFRHGRSPLNRWVEKHKLQLGPQRSYNVPCFTLGKLPVVVCH